MIEYRPFHNADPPKLLQLWNQCELGRGAAKCFSCYAFDGLTFAQPYFDPQGLIVACDDDRVVGYAHAGFGCNADESALSLEAGVICAVMVRPDYRRRGIGRELVRQAEGYLRNKGTADIAAGPAAGHDPFYYGLYGGSQPAGFLESDEDAAPFFQALGYSTGERHLIFQRDISEARDPTNFIIVNIRRQTKLAITDRPENSTWWWMARLGRLDSLRFQLVPKTGGEPLAGVTIVGMDLFVTAWQARAVGLSDLVVREEFRRKGYGQALLVEVARRLRQESITLLEAHAPEGNVAAIGVLQASGFSQVDAGVVYKKALTVDV